MKKRHDSDFPTPKRLGEVAKRLSDPSVLGSSLLPKDASELDRTKYKACELIIKYRHKSGLKQKALAEHLGIDEARMSEILHYKIESFTLDRLVGYAQVLYPNLKLDLIAA
ncbi:XRE family transcriptional regulator [Bdellovibrionota bacterium FG-2]